MKVEITNDAYEPVRIDVREVATIAEAHEIRSRVNGSWSNGQYRGAVARIMYDDATELRIANIVKQSRGAVGEVEAAEILGLETL